MKRNWRLIGSTGVLLFSKSITTLAHKPCSDICPQLTAFRCPSNLYEHCPAFELPVGDDGALRVRGGGAGEDAAESDDRTSPESVTANESIPSPGVCDKEVEADRKQRTNGENEVQEKKGSYSLTGISRDIHDASDAEANDSTSVSPETSIIEDDDAAEPSTLSKPLNDFASSDPEQGENTLNETNLEVPEANASFWDSSSNSLHRFDLLSHKILQLLERHYDNPGSDPTKGNGLRDLVLERCEEYIDELRLRHEKNLKKDKKKRPHHPEKVLHFLAPKIPAIKQSPDFTLRIKSAKAELDGSIAAYMIGSIACLVEMHELVLSESIGTGADDPNNANEERPDGTSAKSLLSDRRLEQLVECVLCGIDTEGDMRELEEFEQATSSSDSGVSDPGGKIATRSTTKGLSVMDASFAAFGLSLLDIEEGQLLSGLSPGEILSSLSLHCRARLLATEQHLRRDKSAAQADLDSIAHDTATALWAFACVKSNTGEYSDSLFDAGASILVFDESALLESKQEEVAMEDIVDRLAAASEDTVGFSSPDHIIAESDDATASIPRTTVDSETSVLRDKNKFADEMKNGSTLLLDRLSQTQAINTLWALAIHGSNDNQALHRKSDSDSSSNFSSVESENFVDLLLGRVATILQAEKDRLMDTPTVINQISGRDDENVIDTSEGQTASAEDWSGSDTQNGDVHMGAKTASETETLLKEHSGIDVEGEAVTSEVREDIRDTEVETNQDGAKVVDGSIDDAGETIQVMSAAAILEAEARQIEKNHRESDELVKISQDSADHDISLVETMNATAMVQTEMEQNSEDHSEVILDKVALIHENCERVDNGDEAPSSVLSLSAKDLCSIAWSATELNRPSSSDIIANAIILLQSFSEEAFLVMDGSALSNIAWAIAKSSEASQGNIVDTSLIYNIADIALKQLRARQDTFQPPELSRLLWSIAVIESSSRGILSGISYRNHTFSKLAILALSIADANLPIFSVEDLSRIVWSFAELTDTSQDMDILPGTSAESFGRIHETIEVSLMRWETGQKNAAHSVHNKDEKNFFSRFPTTFFGKARSTRLPLLDIRIPEVDEYDDDNQYRETLQLPALKDLTVDPSTLCKVAFGSSLISRNHQYIVGSEQILRIATRLFASKDGRLLSECNPSDVVRMCCACVDTMKLAGKEIRGSDREYVLRQFPRRVVQLINAPACRNITSSASNGAHTSYLDQLTPSELSAMLFSLGELGVKLGTGMEPPQAEYRKLRVVPACPCLSTEQLESLTASSAVNLVSWPPCIFVLGKSLQ